MVATSSIHTYDTYKARVGTLPTRAVLPRQHMRPLQQHVEHETCECVDRVSVQTLEGA